MGIFDIDFENIIVKRDKVKDRTVYTIDNYYKYPHAVLNFIRKNESQSKDHTSSYPGKKLQFNLNGPGFDESSEEYLEHTKQFNKLCELIGFDTNRIITNLENYEKDPLHSITAKRQDSKGTGEMQVSHMFYFTRYIPGLIKENQNEWEKNCKVLGLKSAISNPHTDVHRHDEPNSKIGAVCYLSKQCSGGTGLYLNKVTGHYCSRGIEMLLDYLEGKCKIKGFESEDILSKIESAPNKHDKIALFTKVSEEFDLKYIATSRVGRETMSKSDDIYELLHLFPMKFNRLALYEGDLLHNLYIEDVEFWKKHDRITSNYFVHIKWGLSPDGESVDDELKRMKDRILRVEAATDGELTYDTLKSMRDDAENGIYRYPFG